MKRLHFLRLGSALRGVFWAASRRAGECAKAHKGIELSRAFCSTKIQQQLKAAGEAEWETDDCMEKKFLK